MLISYRHRFLFVHIAKTGGTSIREALRPYRWGWPYSLPLGLCSVMSQMTHPRHKLGIKFPRHAKAIAAKEMLPASVFNDLLKFAVVRNPWDLQVSSFHHLRREHPDVVARTESFDAFLRRKFDPGRPHNFLLDISQERQWQYLCDLDGRRIVDEVVRYEELEAGFRDVCARIGIDPPALPHRRRAADRGSYRDYYTEQTRALVAEHYARDIEEFGYAF